MTYARHSLAEGKTEIEVRGFSYNTGTSRGKVYVAQLVRGGETYFVLVDTEGDIGSVPNTDNEYRALGMGLGFLFVYSFSAAKLLSMIKSRTIEEVVGSKSERRDER